MLVGSATAEIAECAIADVSFCVFRRVLPCAFGIIGRFFSLKVAVKFLAVNIKYLSRFKAWRTGSAIAGGGDLVVHYISLLIST